ncbi:acyl transferase domain-containing protein [Aspergillus venezuelensis]
MALDGEATDFRDFGPSTVRLPVSPSLSPSSPSSLLSTSCSHSSRISLSITTEYTKFRLLLPESHFAVVESHRNTFLASYSKQPDTRCPLLLALEFLDFLLAQHTSPNVLSAVLRAFDSEFIREDAEIHSLIANLTPVTDERQKWLRTYYQLVEASNITGATKPLSAFFRHAKTNDFQVMAVFGGQGESSRTCVREFKELYYLYKPMLRRLVGVIGPCLFDLSAREEFRAYYKRDRIDIEAWITGTAPVPDQELVASAPLSVPIIGALSLARYCVTCQLAGCNPGEMRSMLHAVTGHSQGLLAAIAVSASESWDAFYHVAQQIVELLFYLGWECHRSAPWGMLPVASYARENDSDTPSYMLSVRGLQKDEIVTILDRLNLGFPQNEHIFLALVNAYDQFVIAGPVANLLRLESDLTMISTTDNDQSRIPFGNRKPCIQVSFLPVSTPFHTPYLVQAAERVKARFADRPLWSHHLKLPVFHTLSGLDIRRQDRNPVSIAIDAISSERCDWPTALASYPASHVLAFDKGGLSQLTKRVKDGRGVRILQASDIDSRDLEMGTLQDLLAPKLLNTSLGLRSWDEQFQPRLKAGGKINLETRLNRILGAPPIMVAGMTPTTVHPDFVAAIMNAGYHAELAGGGYHSASAMEAAIHDLVRDIPHGRGITCNLIYANPRSISWQITLLRRLAKSGVPIDGLTIGAGVPSIDIASEYIQTLGLRHISFKPGSMSAIRRVIQIAKKHPNFPVILQWTGGRGGGHHSFEDFHAPIIAMYGTLRQQTNIYLVAGSGLGDSNSAYPYLSGSWSTELGHPAMPFDGILLGSRMMVAKEAHTSPEVRRVITATPGVLDAEWERTYTEPAGGVITVTSEMGEPIHKIATRGVLLWAEMDKNVFSLPQQDRLAYLALHRCSIIRRLNADYAKPWFGCDFDGRAVDLQSMTYFGVLWRLIELMCIGFKRWIDASYVDFAMTITHRWLERLHAVKQYAQLLTTDLLEGSADSFLASFANACPTAKRDLLNPEDIAFFLMECKRHGRKPVNFVPALNEDFEFYFKKDSLWQAEDIDSVVGQDAERVCILHGPVAAQYSKLENEPAGCILDTITSGIASHLRRRHAVGEDAVPNLEIDLGTPASWSPISSSGREFSEETSSTSITSLSELADDHYFSSGGVDIAPDRAYPAWVKVLLETEYLYQNKVRRRNPFRCLLETTPTIIHYDPGLSELLVTNRDTSRMSSTVKVSCYDGVNITIYAIPTKRSVPLQLFYQCHPGLGLSEVMERRNLHITSFYRQLWFGREMDRKETVDSTFCGPKITLTQDLLEEYNTVLGSAFTDHRQIASKTKVLPIHVGIIVAWDVISRPLTIPQLGGDLLHLVHHSNRFAYLPNSSPLCLGDKVSSESKIQSIYEDDTGIVVVVEAKVVRDGTPVMTVTSTFLFLESNTLKPGSGFRKEKEKTWLFHVATELEQSLLESRDWFQASDHSLPLLGEKLIFSLETVTRYQHDGRKKLQVTGKVMTHQKGIEPKEIGTVSFSDICTKNPVLDFLERRGELAGCRSDLINPGWAGKCTMDIQMPADNQPYAQLSRDFNPIHTSPVFAQLAGLPGTLCHGMCTSAIAEKVLEHLVLEGDRERLRGFDARFIDMVMPNERLVIEIKHTSMSDGRMCFTITARRRDTDELVLEADAEVDQPRTAYLFTGQGSQSKGMGMDLYESSTVAKDVWDQIDQQLFDAYGWSVLDIVQNNPKTLTVHFGGRNGRKIRQRYLDMTTEVVHPNGRRTQKPVFAGLTATSTCYTFTHPKGLLYSTQFAQPAILLFEAAAFAELRAKGYVSQEAVYAGHSLGEFGALSALSSSIPTGALVELAFYRGSVMQASVSRDDHGATTYGMVAMNPKRVGTSFTQSTLGCLVDLIASQSGELLEIVNFNIKGEQYVCSGTAVNLYVLGKLIDHIASCSDKPLPSEPDLGTSLQSEIQSLLEEAKILPRPIQLQRGKATVPLEGIDVPFHSSHLRNTVDRFRQCLLRPGFLVDNVEVEQLVGRYIPNLMARPFSLDREYIQEAFDLTQSPVLREILNEYGS